LIVREAGGETSGGKQISTEGKESLTQREGHLMIASSKERFGQTSKEKLKYRTLASLVEWQKNISKARINEKKKRENLEERKTEGEARFFNENTEHSREGREWPNASRSRSPQANKVFTLSERKVEKGIQRGKKEQHNLVSDREPSRSEERILQSGRKGLSRF